MRAAVAAVLCVLLLGTVRCEDEDSASPVDDKDVIVLTEENFHITESGSWILEFYAPWCAHCKKLRPIWQESALALSGKINFGKVDCTSERSLQKRFDIKSYPTLVFSRDNIQRSYKGPRTTEALVEFGKEMSSPAVLLASDSDALSDIQAKSPVVFLFFSSGSHGQETRHYEKVAYQLQGTVKFVSTKIKASDAGSKKKTLSDKYKVGENEKPQVIVLSEGGDQERFTGPWEGEQLRYWVGNHSLPLLSDLGTSNFDDVTTQPGKLTVFAVVDVDDSGFADYRKTLISVARNFQDNYVFATIDGAKFNKYVSQFSVMDGGLPALFVLDYTNELYYANPSPTPDAVSTSGVTAFLNEVRTGKISPTYTTPWYSPARYFKYIEKFLGQFSETQLAIGVAVAMALFAAILIYGCLYGDIAGVEPPAPKIDGHIKKDKKKAE